MKSILSNISTIIFDLGGVVLDLDVDLSATAFAELSGLSKEEIYRKFLDEDWSSTFEKGAIDAAAFRHNLCKSLDTELSDRQIDKAWNAMLVAIPLSRLQLVDDLRNKYQTFVLSNTNAIHIETFKNMVVKTTSGGSITDYFDKVYYSNELGMRKPDSEIFSYVIDLNNLIPEETLFIDDMEENVIAAQALGIKTVHLAEQDYLTELLS